MTLEQRWSAVMMNTYGTPALALASGDGAVVTDTEGRSYVDLLGGIAVNILGHKQARPDQSHFPDHDQP